MTRERLSSLPLDELKVIASRYKIETDGELDKTSLIGLLLDYFTDLREEREEFNNTFVRGEEKKYEVSMDEEIERPSESGDRFPIPKKYDETQITALVRDPTWAYAYWEINKSQLCDIRRGSKSGGLRLRVHDITDVDYDGTNSNSHFDIPIKSKDDHWYIHLPKPGSVYVLELIYLKNKRPCLLARSNAIRTPRGGVADTNGESRRNPHVDALLSMAIQVHQIPYPSSDSIPHRVSVD